MEPDSIPKETKEMRRVTITAAEFASALGCSTWSIYEQEKNGTLPISPIRIGRRMVWSRTRVADLIGADPLTGEPLPSSQAQSA